MNDRQAMGDRVERALAVLRDAGREGARFVVSRAIPGDLLTPLGAYLRLRGRSRYPFLLESADGGERLGRYSFVGYAPASVLRARGRAVEIESEAGIEHVEGDPRDVLRERVTALPLLAEPGLPPFLGGAVGFFAYEAMRLVERIPRSKPDPLDTPDLVFAIHDRVVAFDHLLATITLVRVIRLDGPSCRDAALVEGALRAADGEFEGLLRVLDGPVDVPRGGGVEPPRWQAEWDRDRFVAAVEVAKEHIRAGDIFQVVLSRRQTAPFPPDPVVLYRALRALNPSPYLFLLGLGEHTLVGASPEFLVRVRGRVVETLPIAGTRPRGGTTAEDARLEAELLASDKECAEHEMLVDLGRNDLGRVGVFGTVRVEEHKVVQRFSHVMHLVSRVRAELRPGLDALDALYATLPAGTLSGAPKVRAMQIIEALEPVARGVYGGAAGYLDFRGDLDVAIAIRTAVLHAGRVHVQAGAGIVYDSEPHAEFDETEAKARALLLAAARAARGLG
jgi:anthranilate synthase component 1